MAGAAATVHSVEEYLRSVYRPDREFVDGEIQERKLGEWEHAEVQSALVGWFRAHRIDWEIRVFPELRVQVAPTRFRVPDVCVLNQKAPREKILTRPPLVCIEILSPKDRLSRTIQRDAGLGHRGPHSGAAPKRVARRQPRGAPRQSMERVEDYRRFGVPNIWIIDPSKREGFDCRPDGLIRTIAFTAATGPVRLDLEQLFKDLD
ncbi:MAG TPA: Uma2 family endonuclease [Terriglobales bacterium]|nr:Uma2 family endonuclease [Terriglobales bacterium]